MTTVNVSNGTNVRLAGVLDPNNVIDVTDADEQDKFEALAQSRGDFVQQGDQSNVWWVRIRLDAHRQGWVSAVRIFQGDDDEPIPGVPQKSVDARDVTRWL